MRNIIIIAVILMVLSSMTAFASTNQPLKNIGSGLDDMFYGEVEVPDNANETGSKGSPAYEDCTVHTNDDVGRGIARFVGGLWKVATFWYPEDSSSGR